jgi:hypothetical protein
MTYIKESRMKLKPSEWEDRAKMSKKARADFWAQFKRNKNEEMKKTLKVWEDAPMNATGSAVATDKPIVRKKKKKGMYDDAYEVLKRNK